MAPAERMISLRWPVLRYALCMCPWSRRLDERVIQSKSFENFMYPYISMEALLNMTADFPVNLLPRHDNDSRAGKDLESPMISSNPQDRPNPLIPTSR
ncbi:hypothetical protein ZWY2020_037154 [Hordeum vulgare]|nr:hypothetical protein ZWY2020_037154 [Hordeum vulgare]